MKQFFKLIKITPVVFVLMLCFMGYSSKGWAQNIPSIATASNEAVVSTLRDPFKPFDVSPQSTPNPLASPLETYALSQLQFKAIIRGAGVLKGLVEDDQGRGFYVSVGTRIGKHQGVIQEISDKKITIKETQTKFTGEKLETISELYLKKG